MSLASAPAAARTHEPVAFDPRLRVEDPVAAWWLRQVTLRLRREVCWLWHERGVPNGASPGDAHRPPPPTDPLGEALDLARYDAQKRAFFETDVTAAYLTGLIRTPAPGDEAARPAPAGGFGRAADELGLEPLDRFVLALALSAVVDAASAAVFAACANDGRAIRPTLALAQRLWDAPEALVDVGGLAHPLARAGLLSPPPGEWDAPLSVPRSVARQLLFPSRALPPELEAIEPEDGVPEPARLDLVLARLATADGRGVILPLRGAAGAPLDAAAGRVASALGRTAVRPRTGVAVDVAALRTLAWLRGAVLYLPFRALAGADAETGPVPLPLAGLPAPVIVGLEGSADASRLPADLTLPVEALEPLGYRGRLERWRAGLGPALRDPDVERAAADCARRFRVEAPAVDRFCRVLRALGGPLSPGDLEAACRTDVDLGELAGRVEPRFTLEELMLPPRPAEQIREIVRAASALTTVHHEWGTGRAWRESGLSVLFAGAPGTGKTMAAEVIADAVGMPLFRIDLSQVVNKYIGETEKNLRRVFDAADASDVILFFDEADALFGKRTEVRDAHDRYANLEVSYLLERMERFRGLAILATNRKKDLDDAFLRRLRFLVEFPLPGQEERLRIWRAAVPDPVDASTLDLPFLARFALSGGHIRSVVFQACLQSAAEGGSPRLEMPPVVRAVRDELEKAGRTFSVEQFGRWASHVRS